MKWFHRVGAAILAALFVWLIFTMFASLFWMWRLYWELLR